MAKQLGYVLLIADQTFVRGDVPRGREEDPSQLDLRPTLGP